MLEMLLDSFHFAKPYPIPLLGIRIVQFFSLHFSLLRKESFHQELHWNGFRVAQPYPIPLLLWSLFL
jgi:hypothetical protein